jgi:hypothetical protein
MLRYVSGNGTVSHILASMTDGDGDRTVTTLCGKSYPESEIREVDDLKECSRCDSKLESAVEDSADVVLPE